MPLFTRWASLAVLLVAASHGSGQAIRPAEIVLPYQADVQNYLASAVVQADGSWLASGYADAALNITFEQNGDVRQIEHVRGEGSWSRPQALHQRRTHQCQRSIAERK